MELRALGQSGLMISPLGLGSVKFGRNQGVKYPSSFDLPSDAEAERILNLAGELGINLLDTAPAYGSSEERLGKLLRNQRAQWIIGTKVGESFDHGRSDFDFSAAGTRASIERSLRRLHTDWLDIVLIHSDGDDLRILEQEDCLTTLLEMKRAGWIRAVGLSGKTVEGGLLALQHCDLVMVTYNLQYDEELPVIRQAKDLQRGVLIKKGLLSGHLKLPAKADPVLASMRLLFAEGGVSSVVIGTLNPEHLKANVQAAEQALAEVSTRQQAKIT